MNSFEPYNVSFLPPITTADQFSLIKGNTLPIKFTARDNDTEEFIDDDTVNVTITDSARGGVIANFNTTNGVQIDSDLGQYASDFDTLDYPELIIGETYSIQVTFGGVNSLRGFAIAYFTLVDRPLAASTTPTGAPKYRYRTNEDVSAAGSGFTPGTNVDIHVVQDQDWNDGDQIPQDATGTVETVPVTNGDVGPVLVWHAPLAPGGYDIVNDHEPKTASTTQQRMGWTADRRALSWSLTQRSPPVYRFRHSPRQESSLSLACCVLSVRAGSEEASTEPLPSFIGSLTATTPLSSTLSNLSLPAPGDHPIYMPRQRKDCSKSIDSTMDNLTSTSTEKLINLRI